METFALRIQGTPIPIPESIPTGGLFTTGKTIITTLLDVLFVIAIVLALAMLIWGGVAWITSGGNKEKLQKARSHIIYAILGLVIVLLSFLIVNLITNFFGVTLTE